MVISCENCRWWHRPKSKDLNGQCVGPIALWCGDDIYTPKDFYCKFGEVESIIASDFYKNLLKGLLKAETNAEKTELLRDAYNLLKAEVKQDDGKR